MPRGAVPSRPRQPRCGVKHAWQKEPIGLPLYVDKVSGKFYVVYLWHIATTAISRQQAQGVFVFVCSTSCQLGFA